MSLADWIPWPSGGIWVLAGCCTQSEACTGWQAVICGLGGQCLPTLPSRLTVEQQEFGRWPWRRLEAGALAAGDRPQEFELGERPHQVVLVG
jgi:hypothetical protein